jgi:AcrR family transcriptional regulator
MFIHTMDIIVTDKRERILAAAANLIVRNGLQCSMAEIATTAGVATGSLYNYFKSKDDLIWGVYQRLTEEATAALVVEHDPETPHEKRIRRYIEDYIEFIWADRDRAVLFEYLSNVPLIPASELRRAFAPVTAFTSKLIEEAKAAGLLRDLPVSDMGGFIGGGIRNVLKWRRSDGSPLTQAERDHIAEMCWSAIAAETRL